MPPRNRWTRAACLVALAATAPMAFTGCTSSPDTASVAKASPGSATGNITVWGHQGEPSEAAALRRTVLDFNSSGAGVTATLKFIPSDGYTKAVQATDPSKLPDVLEYDGPLMSSFAYAQKLSPLDKLVSQSTIDNQLASVSAQNTYKNHKLYGVSMYDSGMGLYANKRLLDAASIKYPKGLHDAWTADQFSAVLAKLAAKDKDGKVLDLGENVPGEWPMYAFSTAVWSTGSLLMKAGKASGNMNSAAAAKALQTIGDWKRYTDSNSDSQAFASQRVALSWGGHWQFNDYAKALGKQLVVLPLPDFGKGPKTGQGTWAWGISPTTKRGKAAGKFLDYLASDASVMRMTNANAAPPATKSALPKSTLYKPTGPLHLFAEGLQKSCGTKQPTKACVATTRPVTPAYPTLSKEFTAAFREIYGNGGQGAQAALTKAAKAVDLDMKDNNNYR